MRNILIVSILFFFSHILSAQEWQADFEQARAIATKENRIIILVFQGSDWCTPCMKLTREIFSTEEFRLYAKAHFVMLQSDFPRKKKNALTPAQQEKNNRLAETYNRSGFFPLVVVLDTNGIVLGETGYKRTTPGEYIKLLTSF